MQQGGFPVPEEHPWLELAIQGANYLVLWINANLAAKMQELLDAGGQLKFEQVWRNMPQISIHSPDDPYDGDKIAFTQRKDGRLHVSLRGDFVTRLQALSVVDLNACDEFVHLSAYVAFILLHEFAHVVIRWKSNARSPSHLCHTWVDQNGVKNDGDSGFWLESAVLGSTKVVGLVKKTGWVDLDDVSETMYLRFCIVDDNCLSSVDTQQLLDFLTERRVSLSQVQEQPLQGNEEIVARVADEQGVSQAAQSSSIGQDEELVPRRCIHQRPSLSINKQ
jgi:hypothetical protein